MTARFRAALDRRPLLVVPTADDVAEFERDLCAGGGRERGGSITTFTGLARELARVLAVELGPPLSEIQRQALIRAAVRKAAPRRLRRSAARPGFTPAADRLIAELQAAHGEPGAVRRRRRAARGGGLRGGARVDLRRVHRASRCQRARRPRAGERRRARRPARRSLGLGRATRVRLRLRRPGARPSRADRRARPLGLGHRRGHLRRQPRARRARRAPHPAHRRVRRPTVGAASVRSLLHLERHPAPSRPQPVRARGGADRRRRRTRAARLGRPAGRGRGDRDRDRAPARRRLCGRRDRDRAALSRLVRGRSWRAC